MFTEKEMNEAKNKILKLEQELKRVKYGFKQLQSLYEYILKENERFAKIIDGDL